MLKAIPYIGQR